MGISWPSERLSAFEEGLYSVELTIIVNIIISIIIRDYVHYLTDNWMDKIIHPGGSSK
jgi:hypothetical protein